MNYPENYKAHWQAILDHLHACDRHLKALNLPPIFENPDDRKEDEHSSTSDRVTCGYASCSTEGGHAPSAIPISTEVDGVDCVILPCSDFEQLFNDMVNMHDMLDYLIGLQERKETLAETLLGVADKMRTSSSERKNISSILDRMETIANRWANMEITPVENL